MRSRPLILLFGFAAMSLAALLFVPPIPQSQLYHAFADQRLLCGVPHFWNVVSNLAFIVVGALGLLHIRDSLSARIFFLGVFLTGFTSAYYHWTPSDWGLFWDRLPMTFAFMALLANVIEERIDTRAGKLLLWPLVALGVLSLFVWMRFDDLRLYAWVQFFPCIAIPLMFLMLPPKHTGTWLWFVAAGLYALAKLLEHYDGAIYTMLGVMSGHPLKHVAAAGACYAIYLAFRTRKPVGAQRTSS